MFGQLGLVPGEAGVVGAAAPVDGLGDGVAAKAGIDTARAAPTPAAASIVRATFKNPRVGRIWITS